jgi:hypothetical protein
MGAAAGDTQVSAHATPPLAVLGGRDASHHSLCALYWNRGPAGCTCEHWRREEASQRQLRASELGMTPEEARLLVARNRWGLACAALLGAVEGGHDTTRDAQAAAAALRELTHALEAMPDDWKRAEYEREQLAEALEAGE